MSARSFHIQQIDGFSGELVVVERQGREVLVFEVGGRRYGLTVADVQELVRAVAILPLPIDSSFIEGVINLRGGTVPVFDIRARLQLPPKAVELSDHLIIVGVGGRRVALRVDRALELARLDESAIERTGSLLSGPDETAEVAKLPDRLLPLLDLDLLMSPVKSGAVPSPIATAREDDRS